MRCPHWIICFSAAAALLACGFAQAGTLQQVLNRNELRVGYSLAAPWAMRDDEGELSGFEIDVARKLAADMDVEVRFLRNDYDQLIRALEADEIDIIIAGMTITPERALHVSFSQPYAVGGINLATNVSATAEVERFEDLNDPAFSVAVIVGSVAETLAERILPRAQIIRLPDADQAAEALVNGDVALYLDEEPIPTFLELEHPGVVDVPLANALLETRAAFAVSTQDPRFVTFLNNWIEAREADTWLPTTHQYWFGTLGWRE